MDCNFSSTTTEHAIDLNSMPYLAQFTLMRERFDLHLLFFIVIIRKKIVVAKQCNFLCLSMNFMKRDYIYLKHISKIQSFQTIICSLLIHCKTLIKYLNFDFHNRRPIKRSSQNDQRHYHSFKRTPLTCIFHTLN